MKLNGDRISKAVAQVIDADEALSGGGVLTRGPVHLGKQISSRLSALRAGDRAGMNAGIGLRGGTRTMSRDRAHQLAYDNAAGQSCGPWPVPQRWRSIYTRAFVKAAIFAAHTNRDISASSKYGVA
jgi:hypothetical protein